MNSRSWHMQDVPPAQRFAYWREAVCQSFMPLEPEDLTMNQFDGYIEGVVAPSLHISRVQSVPAVIRRTSAGISTFQNGSLYANLQLCGVAIVEQKGERAVAYPGDIMIVDTDVPFSIRFEDGCNLICATIPDGSLRRDLQRLTRYPSVILNKAVGHLASVYLQTLPDFSDDFQMLDDLAADQLSTLLARAAGAQWNAAKPGLTAHETTLALILGCIADELDNPLLSAKFVSRTLNISRSRLFSVLAEAGITFAAYIRRLRLEKSRIQIIDPQLANVTIGDIARRNGFTSQESFNRAFKRHFGAPPGSYRSESAVLSGVAGYHLR